MLGNLVKVHEGPSKGALAMNNGGHSLLVCHCFVASQRREGEGEKGKSRGGGERERERERGEKRVVKCEDVGRCAKTLHKTCIR